MARRYDSRTTTFSPEGRLYQVEYALEAINNASSTLGILAKDGVVIAADKAIVSKLLDQEREKEKVYKIDDHIICAVAGWTADANILLNHARIVAQRYLFSFDEPQPVEQLIIRICDTKQGYTQYGGLRPFGVSFLIAGWDKHFGFQLYYTDPAGNYAGWKATAVGQNNQSAQSILRQEWTSDMTLDDALALAAKVLVKTMDTSSPSGDRLEFATISLDPETGRPVHRMLKTEDIDRLIAAAIKEQQQRQTTAS